MLRLAAAAAALVVLIHQASPAEAFFWKRGKAQAAAVAAEKPEGPAPLTLEEAFRAAEKRSEDLAIAGFDVELARARFYRSLQYFLPDVRYRMTRFDQDAPEAGSGSSDGISSDAARPTTYESKFTFSQPIFSGFREIAALRASGADRNQQRLEYERAKQLLFVDVMESYYALMLADEDVAILESIHKLVTDRLKELGERVELGRSRETEAKTATSDQKLVEADLVAAKNAQATARNLLEFYTGIPLEDRTPSEGGALPDPEDVSVYLKKAIDRADVRAAEEGLRLRRQGVTSAQAGFFPEVSLDGNYYTRRMGFKSGNDWDVLLTVDVPIFDQGQTLGDVKEAWTLRKTAEKLLEKARRTAELDVRNAHEDYLLSRQAEAALAEARRASRESYEVLTGEYRNNLVSNLEVLDALRRYEDVHRRYNQARFGRRTAYWRLRVAAGETV